MNISNLQDYKTKVKKTVNWSFISVSASLTYSFLWIFLLIIFFIIDENDLKNIMLGLSMAFLAVSIITPFFFMYFYNKFNDLLGSKMEKIVVLYCITSPLTLGIVVFLYFYFKIKKFPTTYVKFEDKSISVSDLLKKDVYELLE